MDYDLQRCSRQCAGSGRELAPGEVYYSVLVDEEGQLRRYDYSAEQWKGPPEQAIGWWKAEIPDRQTARRHWAPNDVMLQFFEELAEQPDRQDMRYVLALLLVRRRVMRLEESEQDQQGHEVMVLYCPRRETTYRVLAIVPEQARIDEIQAELAGLLE